MEKFINNFVIYSGYAFMVVLFIIFLMALIYGAAMIVLQVPTGIVMIPAIAGMFFIAWALGKGFNFILKIFAKSDN